LVAWNVSLLWIFSQIHSFYRCSFSGAHFWIFLQGNCALLALWYPRPLYLLAWCCACTLCKGLQGCSVSVVVSSVIYCCKLYFWALMKKKKCLGRARPPTTAIDLFSRSDGRLHLQSKVFFSCSYRICSQVAIWWGPAIAGDKHRKGMPAILKILQNLRDRQSISGSGRGHCRLQDWL
jgi:hypothetical protein